MKELSLHILDIVQNSIAADGKLIEISVAENKAADRLLITIKDDGKGMSPEMVKAVENPFVTGRTTRKVGLGIPLLKNAAENTGGGISIRSEVGAGTEITAIFGYSSIDRQPLGNMAETMLGLITSHEEIDFVYSHKVNDKEFTLDTRHMKEALGGISFKEPEIVLWLSEFLKENEAALYV